MARLKIQLEPVILKYARYCSGYDLETAAKKIKIEESVLRQLESQKGDVTLVQLKKISVAYKMPLAYFLLEKAPSDVVVPEAFRTVYASEDTKLSPAVMLAVRSARYVQSIAKELVGDGFGYDFKSVDIKDDSEKVASYFRSLLEVTLEQQKK